MNPVDEDRARPYVLPGQMTLQTYLQEHGKERALALDDTTFFPVIVWSYFPDIFTCFDAELNWHREMKTILSGI